MLVHRNALALKEGLGNEDHRWALNFLRITPEFTESTNGRILFRLENRKEFTARDYPDVLNGTKPRWKECLLNKNTIDKLEKIVPKKEKHQPLLENFIVSSKDEVSIYDVVLQKDTELHCITKNYETKTDIKQENPDAKFPNTNAIFPKDKPHHQVGISLELLEKLIKVAKKVRNNKHEKGLLFSFQESKTAPIRIDFKTEKDDLTVLIMPYEIDD